MDKQRLTPQCEFEVVSAADVLDGLGTLKCHSGQGIIVPAPGDGPDLPLTWAIQEVTNAQNTTDKNEQLRFCTNAIVNARRALSCLVDWYLERDLATLCKNAPKTAEQKADFLVRRGIIDGLTSRVLERAIAKRNEVEHRYVAPPIEIAEDVVELFRRTMAAIRSQSDPSLAPWIFGIILGGHGLGPSGYYADFQGWHDPLIIFSRFPARPWVGLVIPDGAVKALVRLAFLDTTTADELLQLLSIAEQKYGRTSSFHGLESCAYMAKAYWLVTEG